MRVLGHVLAFLVDDRLALSASPSLYLCMPAAEHLPHLYPVEGREGMQPETVCSTGRLAFCCLVGLAVTTWAQGARIRSGHGRDGAV